MVGSAAREPDPPSRSMEELLESGEEDGYSSAALESIERRVEANSLNWNRAYEYLSDAEDSQRDQLVELLYNEPSDAPETPEVEPSYEGIEVVERPSKTESDEFMHEERSRAPTVPYVGPESL